MNEQPIESTSEPGKEKSNVTIQLEIDEVTAQGRYVNLTLCNTNKEEFILDFIFLQPHIGKARVCSRVILTPNNVKRLASMLSDSVAKYEAMHGPLTDDRPFPGLQLSIN